MKYRIIVFFVLFSIQLRAQLEKVIVETYYISDSLDATDTTGGKLSIGSKTYRIYIDLKPGSKLRKIYGDANHTLKIQSDFNFFNHTDRGQSFGNQFSINHFRENNVALDTWLTLGQVSKTGAKTYFGVLKGQDTDGNLIAGPNNYDGLLSNNNIEAGIPLTVADGIDTMVNLPSSWASYGILNMLSGDDSTIFGSLSAGNQFISNNAGLQNSGVMGGIPDSNQILVAQLTTKGEISFELNVEVEEPDGAGGKKIVYYVANDDTLLSGEKLNRYLKYPFVQVCGCPDPNYLEYKADRDCDKTDSCQTPIVFGCMDTLACNYDPSANYNVQVLCCYPGFCNDRDISVVCPALSNSPEFSLYPNPAEHQLTLDLFSEDEKEIMFEIHNSYGMIMIQQNLGILSGRITEDVNVSNLDEGLYLVRVHIGSAIKSKLFMKN